MPARILVVDRDGTVRQLVHQALKDTDILYDVTTSAADALTQLRLLTPDLVLIGCLLPEMNALALCKLLKHTPRTAALPIVLLIDSGAEADMVAALELGVQSYLTRPFRPPLLLAHIRAALRRAQTHIALEPGIVVHGALVVHPGRHEVRIGQSPVSLKPTQFRILHLLVQYPGRVFNRLEILHTVHGGRTSVTLRSVDVHVAALRRILGLHGQSIETIRGIGYRWSPS